MVPRLQEAICNGKQPVLRIECLYDRLFKGRIVIEKTGLPDVLKITPRVFADSRGAFTETYSAKTLANFGLHATFVQDNQSISQDIGTIRGLHFQAPPSAQAKLVRVIQGEIWDVAVDIRRGSPTFGEHVGVTLSAQNGAQLFIPAGFLHGFVTRTPACIVAYKCGAHYAPETEGAVRFDDPDLGIDWGVTDAKLSEKDAAAASFAALETPFVWSGAL